MRIIVLLIGLFVEAVGLFLLLTGLSFVPPLRAYVVTIFAGHDWTHGELARRFLAVSAPSFGGMLATVGMAFLVRSAWRRSVASEAFADRPWLANPEWASKRVVLSNRGIAVTILIVWLIYLLIVVPGGVMLAAVKLKAGIYAFVGVFGLILLGFTRVTWTNRQWNRSELRLNTLPGVIGGPFSGVAVLPLSFPAGTAFRVALKCEATSRVGGTRSDHSETVVIYQNEEIIDRAIDSVRVDVTELPVEFAVPFDCEPTNNAMGWRAAGAGDGPSKIDWWLHVSLKQETDFHEAKFRVPVYRTPESRSDYRLDPERLKPYLARVEPDAVLARIPILREPLPDGGERIGISLFKRGDIALSAVVSAGCIALTAATIYFARRSPLMLFAILPGFVAFAGVAALVEMLYWGSLIEVRADRIDVTAGYRRFEKRFTFKRGERLPLDCAEDFRKTKGAWWCVRLTPRGSRPVPLIKRLDGRQEAEAMRAWLEQSLRPRH